MNESACRVGNPKPWSYEYQHPSQSPINNPPSGWDPNEPPYWRSRSINAILIGKAAYELYGTYSTHMNEVKDLKPKDTIRTNFVKARNNNK